MKGTVQSGGTTTIKTYPLAGVTVTLFEATADAPRVIGRAKTDAAGKFSLDASHTTSDSIFYATAGLGAASSW